MQLYKNKTDCTKGLARNRIYTCCTFWMSEACCQKQNSQYAYGTLSKDRQQTTDKADDSLSHSLGVLAHLVQYHLHGRVCQNGLHLRVGHGTLSNSLRVVSLFYHSTAVAVQSFLQGLKQQRWLHETQNPTLFDPSGDTSCIMQSMAFLPVTTMNIHYIPYNIQLYPWWT